LARRRRWCCRRRRQTASRRRRLRVHRCCCPRGRCCLGRAPWRHGGVAGVSGFAGVAGGGGGRSVCGQQFVGGAAAASVSAAVPAGGDVKSSQLCRDGGQASTGAGGADVGRRAHEPGGGTPARAAAAGQRRGDCCSISPSYLDIGPGSPPDWSVFTWRIELPCGSPFGRLLQFCISVLSFIVSILEVIRSL